MLQFLTKTQKANTSLMLIHHLLTRNNKVTKTKNLSDQYHDHESKVLRWNKLLILNPKYKWTSKILLLELISGSKRLKTFFRSPCVDWYFDKSDVKTLSGLSNVVLRVIKICGAIVISLIIQSRAKVSESSGKEWILYEQLKFLIRQTPFIILWCSQMWWELFKWLVSTFFLHLFYITGVNRDV